ncbi:MAG: hypothetical protein MI717_04485 [Spirochaetales bacterium]|nr:hypothetical protein [Spirochaetales bacterium]
MFPMRRLFISFLTLAFIVTSLTSCFDFQTEIRLKRNGSVTAQLRYTLTEEAAQFGRGFGADEPWMLPLTEKDFLQQSIQVPGTRVEKYRVIQGEDGSETIQIRLEADSIESLGQFLGMDMVYDAQEKTFELLLNDSEEGNPASVEEEWMETLVRDIQIGFRFRPPSAPVSVNGGTLDGPWAELNFTIGDLLDESVSESWVVSW